MTDLANKILDESWMADIKNDWVKTQAILKHERDLFNRMEFELKRGNVKDALKLCQDLKGVHSALLELWNL